MALVIEDGTIVSGANSYGTTADLATYATARGITISSGKDEEYMIRSMDVIEFLPLPGIKSTETQPLQWPRKNVWLDGYELDNDEIPQLLIDVQFEGAIAINEGYDPIRLITRVTKSLKAGPISKEYASNSPSRDIYQPFYNKVQRLLGGNMNTGFSFRVHPV